MKKLVKKIPYKKTMLALTSTPLYAMEGCGNQGTCNGR